MYPAQTKILKSRWIYPIDCSTSSLRYGISNWNSLCLSLNDIFPPKSPSCQCYLLKSTSHVPYYSYQKPGWTKTQTIANHPLNIYLVGVLDSYSYRNNLQPSGGSKITEIYSLIVREVRGLKSSCQQGHASFESSREPTILVSSSFWWPQAFLDSEAAWGLSASTFIGSSLCLYSSDKDTSLGT